MHYVVKARKFCNLILLVTLTGIFKWDKYYSNGNRKTDYQIQSDFLNMRQPLRLTLSAS